MKLIAAVLLLLTIGGCASRADIEASRNPAPKSNPSIPPVDGVPAYPGALEVNHREYDEGGFHIHEVDLSSSDAPDKIAHFYEPLINARAMPMGSGVSSIQNDTAGKHFEVTFSRFGDESTIQILVKTATP